MVSAQCNGSRPFKPRNARVWRCEIVGRPTTTLPVVAGTPPHSSRRAEPRLSTRPSSSACVSLSIQWRSSKIQEEGLLVDLQDIAAEALRDFLKTKGA